MEMNGLDGGFGMSDWGDRMKRKKIGNLHELAFLDHRWMMFVFG